MRRHRLFTFAFLAIIAALGATASAETINGRRLSVTVDSGRAAQLRTTVQALQRAGVPAYVNMHKITNYPQRQRLWPEGETGATVVGQVSGTSFDAWMREIGGQSVGFMNTGGPGTPGGTGYLRIGKRFYNYNTIRGSLGSPNTFTTGTYVEATFSASPEELAAVEAFYFARIKAQVKDARGNVIAPVWNNPGPSNLKKEGCAGASSSMLNPQWRAAFRRSVDSIRAYGVANSIPELASVDTTTADKLDAFASRIGAQQKTTPKHLTTDNFTRPTLTMVTVFGHTAQTNPLALYWGRWQALGQHPTIPDLPDGRSSAAFTNERLALADFLGALR